jgi:ABC-type transport system substrate-binding protein
MYIRFSILIFFLSFIFLSSCKQDGSSSEKDTVIDIAIPSDPQRINPVIGRSAVSRLIHQYIFLNVADYHPETLELYPVLIKEVPKPEYFIDDGVRKVKFSMEFKEDAYWDDGLPVTGQDYLFTIKMIMHPMVQAIAFRTYLDKIESVEVDQDDEKKFTVTFSDDYMLSLETAVTIPVYPRHIYDPDEHLAPFGLTQLRDQSFIEEKTNADTSFIRYIQDINGMKYSRDVVSNNGPYNITSWTTDQNVVLSPKENYWGSKYPDNPYLQQGPDKMIFYIIPDRTTALSQLKEGSLDVLNYLSSRNFVELRDNPAFKDDFQFYSPTMRRYYYLAMNNAHPILSDVEVRKAMSHLLEVDKIIDNIDYGMGKRMLSLVHPDRPYYNDDLIAIEYDPDKAREILAAAGWTDSDNDGDLDKNLNGSNTDLEIDMYVSSGELGRQVALMLQQNAEKIGIRINIITKEFSAIFRDHLPKRDYAITPLVSNQDLNDDDFYNRWHSDSDDPRSSNHISYRDKEADDLIMAIRNAANSEARYKLYDELQEVIYEDFPVIFLYAPMEKIVVSNRWKGSATAKRPGYLANTFTPN